MGAARMWAGVVVGLVLAAIAPSVSAVVVKGDCVLPSVDANGTLDWVSLGYLGDGMEIIAGPAADPVLSILRCSGQSQNDLGQHFMVMGGLNTEDMCTTTHPTDPTKVCVTDSWDVQFNARGQAMWSCLFRFDTPPTPMPENASLKMKAMTYADVMALKYGGAAAAMPAGPRKTSMAECFPAPEADPESPAPVADPESPAPEEQPESPAPEEPHAESPAPKEHPDTPALPLPSPAVHKPEKPDAPHPLPSPAVDKPSKAPQVLPSPAVENSNGNAGGAPSANAPGKTKKELKLANKALRAKMRAEKKAARLARRRAEREKN